MARLTKKAAVQTFWNIAIPVAVLSAPFVVIGTYQFIGNIATTVLFSPRH